MVASDRNDLLCSIVHSVVAGAADSYMHDRKMAVADSDQNPPPGADRNTYIRLFFDRQTSEQAVSGDQRVIEL